RGATMAGVALWRFNDGTTVHLGGKVEGASLFAQELCEALADRPGVQIWPIPLKGHDLDVNDLALMNAWVTQQASKPYRRELRLRLVEAPSDVPALPPPPSDEDRDPRIQVY